MSKTRSKNIFRDLHTRLSVFAIAQSILGGATFFGVTVLNVPEPLFKEFLRNSVERDPSHYGAGTSDSTLYWLWTALVAATTAGPLIGSFLLGFLASKFGRRDMVMIWNNLFLLISSAFQVLAIPLNSYECLFVGRMFNGICIGMWSFVPVYLAECSPDSCRGLIAMTVGIGKTFWLLIGAILGLPGLLGTRSRLPYLLLVPAVPALIHILLTPLFPKSPKFLFISEKKRRQAVKSVKFFHGSDADLSKILAEFDREAELTEHDSGENESTLSDVLKTRHLRWPLLICVIATVACDCSGTDITNQYSSGLLKSFGLGDDSATVGTIISLLPPFALSIVAPLVVELLGRRKIVLFGISSGLFSVTVLFAVGFVTNTAAKNGLAIVGKILCMATNYVQGYIIRVAASYIGVYLGFGPITGILPGELAPEGSRSITAAMSSFFTWVPSFIILMVFPEVDKLIGSYSYLPFILFGAICGVFLFCFMPETKDKPVDVIIERWVTKKHVYADEANESTPLLPKIK